MNYDFKVAVVPGMDPGEATIQQLNNALAYAVSWVDFLVEDAGLFAKSVKSSFYLSDREKI
jgi:hypothetical protein